jgi:tRNA-dihydrouridine synthase A
VKCRIGVNDQDSYQELTRFIDTVSSKGDVNHFIVHARKAILDANFSPDDNRKIPPLKYDYVYDLVRDFPNLQFTINGGVGNLNETKSQLSRGVHGVMVGRQAVNHPFHWRHVDSQIYEQVDPGEQRHACFTRLEILIDDEK